MKSNVVKMDAISRRAEQYNNMVANIRPLSTYGRGRSRELLQVAWSLHYLCYMWMIDIRD